LAQQEQPVVDREDPGALRPTLPRIAPEAERAARLPMSPSPFSRSQRPALSMSPSLSSSARLASSMPTPVAWRSAWTSFALTAMLRPPR